MKKVVVILGKKNKSSVHHVIWVYSSGKCIMSALAEFSVSQTAKLGFDGWAVGCRWIGWFHFGIPPFFKILLPVSIF